jgi:hypothetical protein
VIINELKLTNFCIYRGEHEFNLAPNVVQGKSKPVVLFGGMNGGGKTTILDSVQLVLYGKRAKCSKRGEKSYEDFLRSCINHQVDPQMGASIGLTFKNASEGTENIYEVQRMWAAGSGGAIHERVLILKDGNPDHWMAENWNQLVDDLIPFGVAQSCFFDAEKIRFLAEDETSNVALGDAIKALLGLNLAERLVADSTVLEGRLAKMSHDQNARVGALVRRTHDAMREFLRRATVRKIARLSDLVTTSFRYLLRKQKLVERVVIDPTDFSITLVDQSGAVLPIERLSEGEKQIFTISVLWGLSHATASRISIPVLQRASTLANYQTASIARSSNWRCCDSI